VSWSILRPILSAQVPSIQAFAETVFLHAISSQQVYIVKDLLSHAHIVATVISNGSALVSAVRTSSCELVSLILHAGAPPNKKSKFGERPLTVVRHVGVAELLLQAGPDMHSKVGSFFIGCKKIIGPGVIAAIASRNIDLVRYLIRKGADVNQLGRVDLTSVKYSAVMVAVECSMSKALDILLQSGARPNETSATTRDSYSQIFPLQEATRRGDLEAVQLLISYGGNVNAATHGASALEAAVSRADVKMTKLLLENRADVNAPGNSDTQQSWSVLTTAVEMNHLELVIIILDAGADVNVLSYGYYGSTALESAICLPHGSDIRDLLVARGARADTQLQTEHRQTQLRQAVLAADLPRVRTLLSSGLKVDMQPCEDDRHQENTSRTKSILQYAVVAGSAIFQMLFDVIKDYDEDIDLHPLLVGAISMKAFDIRAILLNAGADVNATHSQAVKLIGTALMFATRENDFEAVQFLHDKGADVNIVLDGFEISPWGKEGCTALQV
jgi:ankyrin repeat protein